MHYVYILLSVVSLDEGEPSLHTVVLVDKSEDGKYNVMDDRQCFSLLSAVDLRNYRRIVFKRVVYLRELGQCFICCVYKCVFDFSIWCAGPSRLCHEKRIVAKGRGERPKGGAASPLTTSHELQHQADPGTQIKSQKVAT